MTIQEQELARLNAEQAELDARLKQIEAKTKQIEADRRAMSALFNLLAAARREPQENGENAATRRAIFDLLGIDPA